jgi:Ca-activated chloride channel homolog
MLKRCFALTLFLILGWLVGTTTAVSAQDLLPTPPPAPPVWHFDGLRIAYQRVDVTIAAQVATTHVEQLFVNDNDWLLEGTYLFPLPAGAAVSQLTMWVDGRPIEAKILEKGEARAIYDDIVRQLRDPALLEYVDQNAIQANVFPIPPRDERLIEIEYTQALPAENGLIHFVYPQSTDLYTNVPLDEQRIRVDVASREAIRAIYSPSHAVDVFRDGEFRATVGYEAVDVTPEQDFALYYSVAPEEIGLNLLSYQEPDENGFFMLLVAPTIEADEVVAKDVIVVLDTSGSMEGEKLAQAKAAAQYVVEHLQPEDRFNLIAFSSGVRRYAATLVAPAQADDALAFINSLEAVGGTNISAALLEAAALAEAGGAAQRPFTLIFLTDGLATEGITDTGLLLDSVAGAMPSRARLFAFGVGDDVDPDLLDNLAQNHRGATTYVRPGQAIDETVSGFYAKVSTPVLSDVQLEVDGVVVEEIYPQTLPDLFAGTQLVLVGRYRTGGPATITLSGLVNGRSQRFTYRDNQFSARGGAEFIPRLWATRAIGHLLREIRLHGENAEWVQSVVNLSVRYGIITPYTSYLIEEDDIFSQSARREAAQTVVEAGAAVDVTRVVAEAVAEAAAAADLAAAEAPLPAPQATAVAGLQAAGAGEAAVAVQIVGSKTFVLRDGVWTDTTFDSDAQTPREIAFASEAYFDLLAAAPELGRAFALGPQVLVVHGGEALRTVAAPGAVTDWPHEPGARGGEEGGRETAVVTPPAPMPAAPAPRANNWLLLLAGLGVVAVLGLLLWLRRQARAG